MELAGGGGDQELTSPHTHTHTHTHTHPLTHPTLRRAFIMMVVQPGERNIFDQRWIEYHLFER